MYNYKLLTHYILLDIPQEPASDIELQLTAETLTAINQSKCHPIAWDSS